MAENIIEPSVKGLWDPDPGEVSPLCLEAYGPSLEALGASLEDCDPLSTPSSVVGEGEEDEYSFLNEPVGEIESNGEDCTGGGSLTVSKNTVYQVNVTVLVAGRSPADVEKDALDQAGEAFRLNRQAALLAQPGKDCVTHQCAEDCYAVSSWNRQLVAVKKVVAIEKHNEGTANEVWELTIEIRLTDDFTLNVACICPEA